MPDTIALVRQARPVRRRTFTLNRVAPRSSEFRPPARLQNPMLKSSGPMAYIHPALRSPFENALGWERLHRWFGGDDEDISSNGSGSHGAGGETGRGLRAAPTSASL